MVAAEAECDQIYARTDAQAHNRKDFEELLAELRSRLDDNSSLFRSSHEVPRYDASRALHEHLKPLFDALRKSTVTFRSAFTSQVDMHGKALHQSASSIDFYSHRRLSASAAVSNSGSTFSNPVGPSVLLSLLLFALRIRI